MNTVSYAGVNLNYLEEGSGELTILVVGSSIYYPRTFSNQIKRSFRFVFADLPHFVELERQFDLALIDFELYSACIERIRSAANLRRFVIAGHSHHGNIAVEYANRFPQHVSHVVLIGSPPANVAQTMEHADTYWRTKASDQRKAALKERRASVDEEYVASLTPQEAYVHQYVTDAPIYWHDPNYDAAWLWSGMVFGMDAVHAFRDLYLKYEMHWDAALSTTPVLAVMGRDDYVVPHTLWTRHRRESGGVDVRILERSGHTPQLEQPEEFDAMLQSWIQQGGAYGHP